MSSKNLVRSYIHQHNLTFARSPSPDAELPQKSTPREDGSYFSSPLSPILSNSSCSLGSPSSPGSLSSWGSSLSPSSSVSAQVADGRATSCENSLQRAISSPKLSLSARFPFSTCTDPMLRESRHSVDVSVRDFVSSTGPISFSLSLRKWVVQSESSEMVSPVPTRDEEDCQSAGDAATLFSGNESSTMATADSACSVESLTKPSILVWQQVESQNWRTLVEALHQCFSDFFGRKSGSPASDALFSDTVSYATNIFLQEFSASGCHEFCSEFLNKMRSGELDDMLATLLDEAEEKHIQQGFDDLQDLITESVTQNSGSSSSWAQLEQPGFYQAFRKIWRLNEPEFLEYDLDTLLSFCHTARSRPYTNFSLRHQLLDTAAEAAVYSNLKKFYFYYRREVRLAEKQAPFVSSFDIAQIRTKLYTTVQNISQTTTVRQNRAKSVSKKVLRFDEKSISPEARGASDCAR